MPLTEGSDNTCIFRRQEAKVSHGRPNDIPRTAPLVGADGDKPLETPKLPTI